MQTLQLTATKREAYGKKNTKALRREGMVPGVIYGGAEEVTFAISEKALKPLIYTPNAYIVEIDIEGKKR
jgi:large subunit ribosomal protein L25